MGDASLSPEQVVGQRSDAEIRQTTSQNSLRNVNVLVTGFGPFRSYATNTSYLVASHLARHLNPESTAVSNALKHLNIDDQHPIRDPDRRPYQISIQVYPPPVRVAYDAVGELVPRLVLDPEDTDENSDVDIPPDFVKPSNGFDYVLHIGMAAGRESYTLETLAHRDHYDIKDVDGRDGSRVESSWQGWRLPEVLDVGWHKEDVLLRWEALTRQREDEYEREEMVEAGWKDGNAMTLVETARMRSLVFLGKGKRAVVKLSQDAGRYLCEFIFYTGLATRWRQARDAEKRSLPQKEREKEKIGKVAFLHVPGGTQKHDIARGVRVAESAILAIVGSWEDGYRNPDVYTDVEARVEDRVGGQQQQQQQQQQHQPIPTSASVSNMYEAKSTGDR